MIAPKNHYPENVEDIRYGHKLDPDSIASQPKMKNPDIARWWGQTLLLAADTPGLTVEQDGSISIDVTEEDRAKILDDEQKDYERGHELYQHYLDTGEQPEYNFQWETYLHHEKITVEKEEDDE